MTAPDYARIAQLERELGIGQPDPEPERGIRENRTWSGFLVRRVHEH